MLNVRVMGDEIRFGESVTVGFERTLRIPDDGRAYAVPPGLDTFPLFRVEDHANRVPASWRKQGGVFLPMCRHEAMWVSFSGRWWKPNAVKIGIGRLNVVSGRAWGEQLCAKPQDYIVVPDQAWLDGIRTAEGHIRQFVAMPPPSARTGKGCPAGKGGLSTIRLVVFEPRPGRFPETPPKTRWYPDDATCHDSGPGSPTAGEQGSGDVGLIRQRIRPDEYGLDAWDPDNTGSVYVHIVDSRIFREITGTAPPPTSISVRQYTEFGVPWPDECEERGFDGTNGHSRRFCNQPLQNPSRSLVRESLVKRPTEGIRPPAGAQACSRNWNLAVRRVEKGFPTRPRS